MLKKIIYTLSILAIGIIISACDSNTNDSVGANAPTGKEFIFENIRIASIEGTKEKYKIDNYEEDGEGGSLNDLLDSLPIIATVNAEFENNNSAVELTKGNFYNINIDFTTEKIHPKGLGFSLSIQNIDDSNSVPISLDNGFVDDINETGEYALNIETLIPDDVNISAGKYILFIEITGADVNLSKKSINSFDDLKKYAYIGGFYVKIEEKNSAKTIDIVDSLSEKYLDLPIDMTFTNGYSNDFLGKSTLVIYSTVSGKEPLDISAILEVDGVQYTLGLLDTNDGIIKDKVTVTIPTFDGNNISGGDRDLSYYLPEASYTAVLEKAPDLAKQIDTDGIEGKIKWSISTKNTDIETNDIEEHFLISKYLKNFSQDNFNTKSISQKRLSKGINLSGSGLSSYEYNIMERKSYVSYLWGYARNTESYTINDDNWKNIKTIRDLNINKVDAALDYDETYIYLFSGNSFVKYNKKTKVVDGEAIKLKTKWPKIEFDSIDAAFRWDKNIYFFSGHKYARYTPSNEEFYTRSNIKNSWDNKLGAFAPFDAAVRGIGLNKNKVFFVKGDQFIAYNFAKDVSDSPRTIPSNGSSLYNLDGLSIVEGLSAAANINDSETMVFKEPEGFSSKLLNEGILFKYNAGFIKGFGKRDKFSVQFKSNNEIQAKWSLPSTNAESVSGISMYVYNNRVSLLELSLKAGVGLRKTHPAYKTDDEGTRKKAKTSRYGAKAMLSVLGISIVESGGIEEGVEEEELDTDNAKEEIEKAEEEGKKNKRSLKMPEKEWDEEKVIFTHNFFTETGFPLEAEFGVAGSIAIKTDFDIVGAGLELKVETPMAISSFVRGNFSIYVAKIGVEAKVNIIETGGEAAVGAAIRINDEKVQIVGKGDVNFYLRLINGEFNIVGKIYSARIWSIGWKKKTWNIYTSPWLFNREWKLLKYEKGINIFDLKKVGI